MDMPMVVKVRHWGNRLGLRLPGQLMLSPMVVDAAPVCHGVVQVVDMHFPRRHRHKLRDMPLNSAKPEKNMGCPSMGKENL